MKTHWVIFGTLWVMMSFQSAASVAKDAVSEEYVYLLKSEGGKVYRMAEETTRDKKESVKKELGRMERIPSGTVVEIEKGASVWLTCGGCRVLNLSHKDSPFVIRMEDFRKDGSTTGKLIEYFTVALNHYIHPDSKPGPRVRLQARGDVDAQKKGLCKDLWPPDGGDIMLIEPITLKWGKKGTHHSLEIKESGSNAAVYSEKTRSETVAVPPGILKPGRKYEWSLLEEETGETCRSTFALLSKFESGKILETARDLTMLLPPGTDRETRCRLQAGYLASEGLDYDAWMWLDRNGISQNYRTDGKEE